MTRAIAGTRPSSPAASRPLAVAAALALGACSCAVGPDYRRPELDLAPAFVEAQAGTSALLAEKDWWASFGDPVLEHMVERALASAPKLREAEARLREARAMRSQQVGLFFPQVASVGSYSNSRISEHGFLEGLGGGSSGPPPPGAVFPGQEIDLYQLGFDAQWELDFFGHVRRSVEAAGDEVGAAAAGMADARRSLAAETAREVVELRSLDDRIAIAEDNIAAQKETLEILAQQRRAGVASDADVARADGQLAGTQSEVPVLRAHRAAALHRLEALLGAPGGSLDAELAQGRHVPMPSSLPSTGLPSDLLLHRPDVARAERELAAATARSGVARAELFPRFSLTGDFGVQAQHPSDLMTSASRFWYVGPGMHWPIFEAGRLRAAVKAADARTDAAAARYEIVVRGAIAEVETTMAAYAQETDREQLLARAAKAEAVAADAERDLYRSGLTDLLHVLDAERARFRAEDALARSRADLADDAIALYKAAGGGWSAEQGERPLLASPAPKAEATRPSAGAGDDAAGRPAAEGNPPAAPAGAASAINPPPGA